MSQATAQAAGEMIQRQSELIEHYRIRAEAFQTTAQRIAAELLSVEFYQRHHQWGMIDCGAGMWAFSEAQFYKNLSAYLTKEFGLGV